MLFGVISSILVSSISFNIAQQVPYYFRCTFSMLILPLYLELYSVVNIEKPTSCSLSEFYIARQWVAKYLLGRHMIWKLSSFSELHVYFLWNGNTNLLKIKIPSLQKSLEEWKLFSSNHSYMTFSLYSNFLKPPKF